METEKDSYRIPPQFHRLTSLMTTIEFHRAVLYGIVTNSEKSLTKVKTNCIKTVEHFCTNFYEEIEYIHANTTNQLRIKKGKNSELNTSYLKCIEIAVDLLLHIDSWGDWYTSALKARRQNGKANKLEPNNVIYKKVTSDLKKTLGRELDSFDFPLWIQTLRDTYPTPPVISATRNLKKKSNLSMNPVEGELAVERENPWPEPTARKKFEELTGCIPTKKRISSLK